MNMTSFPLFWGKGMCSFVYFLRRDNNPSMINFMYRFSYGGSMNGDITLHTTGLFSELRQDRHLLNDRRSCLEGLLSDCDLDWASSEYWNRNASLSKVMRSHRNVDLC